MKEALLYSMYRWENQYTERLRNITTLPYEPDFKDLLSFILPCPHLSKNYI